MRSHQMIRTPLVMKRIAFSSLVIALGGIAQAQVYDFSAATTHLDSNLAAFNNRVLVIVEHETKGEIFRYRSGLISQDTKLPIASASKWLSAAVVLSCAEKGWFNLDDRVGQYLPIFDTYGKGHITIRQCFSMKSGLSLVDPAYELDSSLTLQQSVDLIAANTPIVFTPGTMLDYQADGMQTVGRICEVVTGKDWRTLAREVLFDPLDMPEADYDSFGLNPAVAGGVRCSAAEYLKFLRMILRNGLADNGKVILSSRSVQEFFTNQTFGLPEYSSPIQNSEFYVYGERPDYGMGSWVMAQNPTSGGVEEVASPGAFGAFPWVDRKRRLRGIIFMLGVGSTAWPASVELQSILRAEIDLKGLPAANPPSPITTTRVPGYLQLSWSGGGLLETSTDLQNWVPLPWASTPFIESLDRPPGQQMFYRVGPD